MVNIMRFQAKWTGFSGAPGYTNMYFRDFTGASDPDAAQVSSAMNRFTGFFNSLAPLLPAALRIEFIREVDIIESTTGELQNSIGFTGTLGELAGTATGSVAGPAGAVVNWKTSTVRKGRRMRGRTFLVPLAVNAYETNGTLTAGALTTITSAATTLADSTGTPDLGVWGRPDPILQNDGVWAPVTSSSVPDLVAVLRSRRD